MADTTPAMSPQQLVAAARGKDPMRGLCASRQITDEGCDWLKFALDPFHDLQLDNLKGYPDVNTEPTVIVKVRQAIEISAPASLPANTNWDCHVALSPVDWAKPNGTLLRPTTGQTGYNAACVSYPQGVGLASTSTLGPAGQVALIGSPYDSIAGAPVAGLTGRVDGLVINSVPAGGSLDRDMTFTPGHMPLTPGNGYAVDNINLDKYLDYADTDLGVYRVIYSGFEVVNTTAQIYKQGACTVYEYSHSYENAQATVPWTSGSSEQVIDFQSVATNQFRSPPNTIAEAKIMPGSHTWAAQDGAYCTAKFMDTNPFQGATNRNYIFQQNNPTAGGSSGYGSADNAGTSYPAGSICSPGFCGNALSNQGTVRGNINADYGGNPGATCAPATHLSHMSTAGAYFTGLSPQTTLFITWRVGLERLPAANKPTFLALAQPSATFDPQALLLYNLIANNLPPGCPQGWNDLGKWFTTIANIAKRVIPGAFPLVSAAQMILNGLGLVQHAKVLPDAVRGAQQVVQLVRGAGKKQSQAVRVMQTAARGRQSRNKQAVQNFGPPAGPSGNRTPRRGVQQFSQMSK